MLHYSPMAARLTIDLPAWVEAATADGQTFRDDHDKMALVIRLAEENATRGEGGPFGAAVLSSGRAALLLPGSTGLSRPPTSSCTPSFLR
jgi:hypothetical protein